MRSGLKGERGDWERRFPLRPLHTLYPQTRKESLHAGYDDDDNGENCDNGDDSDDDDGDDDDDDDQHAKLTIVVMLYL